jgi:bifunctional non-homologous end joining protein LigD
MALGQEEKPFDDPNWVFEIKHDGFRALALIDKGHCWLLSRRKLKFHTFGELAAAIGRDINADMAVLDGELAIPDETGRTVVASMIKRRRRYQPYSGQRHREVRYYAFDLLWLNGKDLRGLPLLERKRQLKHILPSRSSHVRYVEFTRGAGTKLYRLACQLDLEGIVAKEANSLYVDHPTERYWIKIKNPKYSRKEGPADLLKRVG